MMARRVTHFYILVLLGSAAAAASSASRLRGGVSQYDYSSRPSIRRSYPSQGVAPARSPLDVAAPEMSDAERVYVVQQFSQQQIRKRFLKRVYAILAVQLAATAGLTLTIRSTPALLMAVVKLQWVLLMASLGFLSWLGMSERARKEAPLNGLLLTGFTLAQGALVGAMTARFPGELVLRAAGATAVATASLSAYAMQTKRDFTMMGGLLSGGLMSLIGLMLIQAFFGGSWANLARIWVGVLIFCAYIVYNTQMMMGGGKKNQLRPDEHIMAAIQLYLDIINLFMYMLQALANSDR